MVGLSAPEKAEAAHGDIRVPASSVRDVEVLDVVVHAVHGLKFPGARWPGRFAIGTFYLPGETKTFAVVHHDTPRGLRYDSMTLPSTSFVVGCADPEAAKGLLERR